MEGPEEKVQKNSAINDMLKGIALLQLFMVVVRAIGIVDWPWEVVTAPVWVSLVLMAVTFVCVFIAAAIYSAKVNLGKLK